MTFSEKFCQLVWDYALTFDLENCFCLTLLFAFDYLIQRSTFSIPHLRKKAVLPSTVAKQIDEAWNQGGNSKSFSCTKWRKSVVTAVSNHLTGNRFCLNTFVLLLVPLSEFDIFVVNSMNHTFS